MAAVSNIGYSPQSALADLIDNSISAGANEIHVKLSSRLNGSVVYIADNGSGMSEETLIAAMQYGSKPSLGQSKLSVYGLGLKAASSAFSTRYTVVSRDKFGIATSATWDLDEQSDKPWQMLIDEPKASHINVLSSVAGEKSGTVVIWEKADLKEADPFKVKSGVEKTQNRIENAIRDHLGMTFHRFLEGSAKNFDKIKIYLNEEEIVPWNPVDEKFLMPGWEHEPEKFTHKMKIDDVETEVPYFIRACLINADETDENYPGAHKDAKIKLIYQGIYAYREDRLLQPPGWLGVRSTRHNDYNTLRLILDLDPRLDGEIKTDVKKSGIQLPLDMFGTISDTYEHFAKVAKDRAKKLKNKRAMKKTAHKNLHGDSGKILSKHENDLPLPHTQRINKNDVQVDNTYGTNILKIKESPPNSLDVRVSSVDQLDDGILYEPYYNGSEITIRLNRSHPFYQKLYFQLIDNSPARQALDALFWTLGRAEIEVVDRLKNQFEDMRFFMSRALRQLADDLEDPDLALDQLDEDAS